MSRLLVQLNNYANSIVFKFNFTYHSVLTVLMKNCEPLVFGPVFAIDKLPAKQRKCGISKNKIRKMIHNC